MPERKAVEETLPELPEGMWGVRLPGVAVTGEARMPVDLIRRPILACPACRGRGYTAQDPDTGAEVWCEACGGRAMLRGRGTVSDGTLPCPVPAPDTGAPCIKRIPVGWKVEEGHPGGHWWEQPATTSALQRGHYDAGALLAGRPVRIHQPEDCTPACPKWRETRRR